MLQKRHPQKQTGITYSEVLCLFFIFATIGKHAKSWNAYILEIECLLSLSPNKNNNAE